MSAYERGRAPGRVHGPNTAAVASVRAWVAPGEPVTIGVWQLWERAARTQYRPGEPVELTQARDELELFRDVARELHAQGTPALLPAHVVNALKVAGWVE